ncbi:UNVERIFIED_CONTAM: hypothetical protein GTU68_028150 [Idotea baltica]|nr:hypothetical protein [Idotea baltica]
MGILSKKDAALLKDPFADNNPITIQVLGICSALAITAELEASIVMSISVLFVMGVGNVVISLIRRPEYADYDLSFLSFIMFIATIATMVQLVEIIVEKFSPSLYNSLGIFLPLIAVNCAILGGSLFMQSREIATLGLALNYGVGSGIGWFLAILSIAAIREKIRYSNVPAPLRGLGITFIITGLMAIGFMSFGGMLTGGDEAPAPETETAFIKEIKEEEKQKDAKVVTNLTLVETVNN